MAHRTLPPPTSFFGTDTDADAISWCRRNLRGEFSINAPYPPAGFTDRSFDLIYAISVFTHLDADLQAAWLQDFARMLRPGGRVLITVQGSAARSHLSSAQLADLARDGFLFVRSSKLASIVPDWYHTSFHTEPFVRRLMERWFTEVAYLPRAFGDQDAVIATTKDAGLDSLR